MIPRYRSSRLNATTLTLRSATTAMKAAAAATVVAHEAALVTTRTAKSLKTSSMMWQRYFLNHFFHAGAESVRSCRAVGKLIQPFNRFYQRVERSVSFLSFLSTPLSLTLYLLIGRWFIGKTFCYMIMSRCKHSGYRVIVSSSEFYYLDCDHCDFLGNNNL